MKATVQPTFFERWFGILLVVGLLTLSIAMGVFGAYVALRGKGHEGAREIPNAYEKGINWDKDHGVRK